MLDSIKKIEPVSIVGDGVIILSDLANGRPIPVIIVDARDRADIIDYLELHKNMPPGDVEYQWGTGLISRKSICLSIKSLRPVPIEFTIDFDVGKHHALIDGIVRNRGFLLQAGMPGDNVSSLMEKGKVMIEIGSTGIEFFWEKTLCKTIKKRFKSVGLGRKQTEKATNSYIESMREFWDKRKDT